MTVVQNPVPAPPRSTVRVLDPARLRAWLFAAVAVLLVLIYLTLELTYASSHLPPARFRPVAPGAVGHGPNADFRLLSLRSTERWGTDVDGSPASPDPGAVWVVARLEITPRRHQDYVLCTSRVVAADGRSWAPEGTGPVRDGERCAPDPENVQLGATYPFVLGFQVPRSEADQLAGVAIETFSGRAQPLLRPPA